MDLYELFNTPIDELYDRGILPEPKTEHNVKMLVISLKCSLCNLKYTERYNRQNPDRLARDMNCPHCGAYTWVLVSAIPYTSFYKSRGVEHASFCDDIAGECWDCGRKHNLLTYTFSNAINIELCQKHFKRYHKDIFQITQKHVPGTFIEGFMPMPKNWDDEY